MSFRIEILENNTVEIFNDEQEEAIVSQPYWPNQTAWASADEARGWAEMYVEAMEVAEAPWPPIGPGEEPGPKLTEEQKAALLAEYEAKNNPTA